MSGKSKNLIALDIGGTHARFSRSQVAADGQITLGDPVTLKTSDYAGLKEAWEEFSRQSDSPLPRAAAIAIAAPINDKKIIMTNNDWVLHPQKLGATIGLDEITIINDFGAVAHAVAHAANHAPQQLAHITGPTGPVPKTGTVSVIGPGTGLGVAYLHRFPDGTYHAQSTEGGHVNFAPVDEMDDAMMAILRESHGVVCTEHINSGPGIIAIYTALARREGQDIADENTLEDTAIWQAGLARTDPLAVAAIDRFCLSLGSLAGDFALGHGANAVVLAGGLGLRLKDILPGSGFAERFTFKGNYKALMETIPVKLITHPQPGLYGAVAAFSQQYPQEHEPT